MNTKFYIIGSILLISLTGCANVTPQSSGVILSSSIISSTPISSAVSSTGSSAVSSAIPTAWPELELVNAYPNISFEQPLEYLTAPGNNNWAFVVSKTGIINVFDNIPDVAKTEVFLDIRSRVVSNSGEKGLLGMAFHPGFASNGYFYVNYTNRTNTVIARYQVNLNNPKKGLADSEKIILTVPQPFANHNGGHLDFGPDGYLYIGMGDGGSRGDPLGNAQNLKTILGKMLRIDVDNIKTGLNYGIPADNPFAGNKNGYREEIWAYGFRNPWKFSFDSKNDSLWVADVGQDTMEEIDIVKKGLNYGWNKMEGNLCYPSLDFCRLEGMEYPVWEYRQALGKSITGGYVYYGSRIPDLYGTYIYGDYVVGIIWGLRINGDKKENHQFLDTVLNISSFGIDKNNEIYILDLNGRIYKFK